MTKQLELTRSLIRRVYQRFLETGEFSRRPETELTEATTARDDRFVVSTSVRNRHLSSVQVQQ